MRIINTSIATETASTSFTTGSNRSVRFGQDYVRKERRGHAVSTVNSTLEHMEKCRHEFLTLVLDGDKWPAASTPGGPHSQWKTENLYYHESNLLSSSP